MNPVLTRLPNDGAKAELNQLEREIQEQLRQQAVEWLSELEVRRAACADLIIRLEDVIAHPNY